MSVCGSHIGKKRDNMVRNKRGGKPVGGREGEMSGGQESGEWKAEKKMN